MLPALLPVIGSILDKVIPDPQAAADAKLKALELAQKGELAQLEAETELAKAQIEVNKVEAGTDIYRGGWRPAAGWCCVIGLTYSFILQPLLPWVINAAGGHVQPMPTIDNETLMVLLFGMLGLSGMRSYEKAKGKA